MSSYITTGYGVVNPVARIDASDYGIDVPCAIIKYAKELCIE